MTSHCDRFYLVQKDDGCADIASAEGIGSVFLESGSELGLLRIVTGLLYLCGTVSIWRDNDSDNHLRSG